MNARIASIVKWAVFNQLGLSYAIRVSDRRAQVKRFYTRGREHDAVNEDLFSRSVIAMDLNWSGVRN